MANENKVIYMCLSDLIELPEVRECKIIRYLKGKCHPKENYVLVEINPPLSPFPECNITKYINEIILVLVGNRQTLDDVGKGIVMAEIVYPGYTKKGDINEDISIKLGYSMLYSDFDSAIENAKTYKEMLWQLREHNHLDIKIDIDGSPNLRRCEIIKQLEVKPDSKDKYYLVKIVPSLSTCVENISEAILAFIHKKHDLIAVKDGEAVGEFLYSNNLQEGLFDKIQRRKLGNCVVYFKF